MASKFNEWFVDASRPLRSGGQADVFVVQRTDDSASYVLKRLLNPKRDKRFLREVQTMRDLQAEGVAVPPVIGEGTTNDKDHRPYYVMPYYPGGSLQRAVDAATYVKDPERGIRLLAALAAELAAMHNCDCAHRDMKPDNVLIDENGKPLLADFGLAISIDEDEPTERLTAQGEAVGSRLYIAPENESGFNPELDQRPADFYAFGKIAWAVVAGREPPAREAQTRSENRLATILERPELARIDALLEALVTSDVRGRLADWTVVEQELIATLRALSGEPASADGGLDLSAVEQEAHLYAGSSTFRSGRDLQAENRRRGEKIPELWRAAEPVLKEYAEHFARLSAAALGMEIGVVTMGAMSLEWLQFASVLQGIGRYGQPGWEEIPGTTTSLGSSPIAVIGISRTPTDFPVGPQPDLTVSLHAYIEDWQLWLVQIACLWVAEDSVRLPPFLADFKHIDGPYRLGLGAALDATGQACRRLATEGIELFHRYLRILNNGDDPMDPGAWAKLTEPKLGPSTPSLSIDLAIEALLDDLELALSEEREGDAQAVAFQLAAAIAKYVDAPREVTLPSARPQHLVRYRTVQLQWIPWKADQTPYGPFPHVLRAHLTPAGKPESRRELIVGRPPFDMTPELSGAEPAGDLTSMTSFDLAEFGKEARAVWAAFREAR